MIELPAEPLWTDVEAYRYLRLDSDDQEQGDPAPAGKKKPARPLSERERDKRARERLRNLVRRQNLPVLKRGRLRLYRKADIDRWLAGERSSRK